ncbi:NB-ARC domain-containing protein [Reticulomyxa filosa]|uniref:NB-ARC domain-containing protein n=1 Tax=Reticulomyxa filosa TaxID=46433 RepID=X6NF60_RETFI|nr:NB-ARC domain-containing protein [Reticulomyxa filosa]|eukprot:ETO24636.1 NB-ARC domain-containing protein [Reticulomyxa filosa]
MKKAEEFNLVVSEDKDFFVKQSKTHHRFHNIKLYVPKHDVYVEMQATLKNFTTLEGYTVIENPKLSHLFYELIRAWKPSDSKEEELKQSSDDTLAKINDIICEWINEKEIKKIASRYKAHSEIGILKPPQLNHHHHHIIIIIQMKWKPLGMHLLNWPHLCKAIYVILFEYYKKWIIGDKHPATRADVALMLQEARRREIREDATVSQAISTYIPLQANNYPHIDGTSNDAYDCHQHVMEFLKKDSQHREVMVLQGKSGSGKSLFCRFLEKTLWEDYSNGLTKIMPIFISLPKYYNAQNERKLISQALQSKQIGDDDMIDIIRESISFVFIFDCFDEIFDTYNKHSHDDNERYFFERFDLGQWNAKVIVTCRSNALNEEDSKATLIRSTPMYSTSVVYLWPFSTRQMHLFVEKFVKLTKKNKSNANWTPQQYIKTLEKYPSLHKMVEEPFFLWIILSVLPSLIERHSIGTVISKAQVYEAFNEQWIDIHVQNICTKLAELRVQTNPKKMKLSLQKYCEDLAFEMFLQGHQVAIESSLEFEMDSTEDSKESQQDILEITDSKSETLPKMHEHWQQYFKGDSIAKCVLRRIGDNQYTFLHKSCQEYFAAHKIIKNIIEWKPIMSSIGNEEYQRQFGTCVQMSYLNQKLLNDEIAIIQFIAERVHEKQSSFSHLQSRLFRIIESSKANDHVCIAAANAATILNSARANIHHQTWDNIKIPHAILDHAFLEGTDFTNANLEHVSFVQALLKKANFQNASMNQAFFGEYANIGGHKNVVTAAEFSPDGKTIVSSSWDRNIRLWDAMSGQEIRAISGHEHFVTRTHFSPNGRTIISCSEDQTIRIWEVASGQEIRKFVGHDGPVTEAKFSSDSSKIVSCAFDQTIRLWDVQSGRELKKLEGHSSFVAGVQFSPDGRTIVSCSDDQTIRIWDATTGVELRRLEGHTTSVTAVQLSSDGQVIISCSFDQTIRLWDAFTGKEIQRFEGHTGPVTDAQMSPDNQMVVSGSWDRSIRVWHIASGREVQRLEGHVGGIRTVQFSLDSRTILSCSDDATIRRWDVISRRDIQKMEGHSNVITNAQFSSNGATIVTCSFDQTIRLWDVASGREIQKCEGHSHYITAIHFSPDASMLVSCSADKTIRLWDIQSGSECKRFEGHNGIVTAAQFTPDGQTIVSSSWDRTIKIWDVASGQTLKTIEGHSDGVRGVQVSSDGRTVVSCSDDKTIRIWDLASGLEIKRFEGHANIVTKAQFSPDGRSIISCSFDQTIILWDVNTGKELKKFEGHSNVVRSVQYSPHSSIIVSCSDDRTIRLWDIASGLEIYQFEKFTDYLTTAQFSPDGRNIVSCSWDQTIRLWDIAFGVESNHVETATSQNLLDGRDLLSSSASTSTQSLKVLSVKLKWQGGMQNCGLSMIDSFWKDVRGLDQQQELVVKQRGGIL